MKVLRHHKFDVAVSQLSRALDQRRVGGAIFLVGPSGVGKTTLRHSVLREVYGGPLQWPVGMVPVIETIATLPTNSFFNSRALATELAFQLDRPGLPWIESGARDVHLNAFLGSMDETSEELLSASGKRARATEAEQWRILERYIRARGCLVVSIDQATALLKNRRSKDPTDHMLHLMTFAEKAGITLLLTGVPDVIRLWDIHSELRRRVEVVWMPPYSEKAEGDRARFAKLLSSFQRKYPSITRGLLHSMDVELLAACGGVYAELEQLLIRAVNRAADNDRAEVGKRDIHDCFHSQEDLEALWRDVHRFHRCMSSGSLKSRVVEIKRVWT